MSEVYFTTKVATDSSFCNRVNEQQLILQNIEKNQHTVVVAPRRYGKTSLVMHALNKRKHIFARTDLFCVVYEEEICRKVARAISEVIKRLMSFSEKTMKMLSKCFKTVSVGLKAGNIELNIEFSRNLIDPIEQLEDLLAGLETLASAHKISIVLFFDEFQDVLKIDQTHRIQAVIRSIAQHSKYVTYIFSGSSRQMLSHIFDDRNQPLYMLCHKIILDRISAVDFKKHIQDSAQKNWKLTIADAVLEDILNRTQCHPFYVNMLCDKLLEYDHPPELKDLKVSWAQCLFENKGKIISDLEPLNSNRTKVLSMVALLDEVAEPNGKDFLNKIKLPLTSTQNAIKYLLDHDYLYQSHRGLKLVDPLMREFIMARYAA